jgi:hypothetical protein
MTADRATSHVCSNGNGRQGCSVTVIAAAGVVGWTCPAAAAVTIPAAVAKNRRTQQGIPVVVSNCVADLAAWA